MTRNHLSGGGATGDQRGSNGTRAATVHPEFRESHNLNEPNPPTREEVEEAKTLLAKAEPLLNAGRCNIPHSHRPNMRVCGYVLHEDVAGLSDAIFMLEALQGLARMAPSLIARAEKAEQALAEAVGWRDISSAPRDGTPFKSQDRANYGERVFAGTRWYSHPSVSGWVTDDMDCGDNEFEPTHWTPEPPRTSEEG